MEIRVLSDSDHEVLGRDYCSGYTDNIGKWNTGFFCPTLGNGEPVYCCGTATYKYCCTKKDEEKATDLDQTVLLGIILGTLLVAVLCTVVSCFCCKCCLLYRRRQPAANGGPMYRMHCSSTASGVANMYSFSSPNSAATTPIDTNDPQIMVDLDCHPGTTTALGRVPAFAAMQSNVPGARSVARPSAMIPEPPPPYQASTPTSSILIIEREPPRTTAFPSPSTSSFSRPQGARSSTNQRPSGQSNVIMEDNLYWSTKF